MKIRYLGTPGEPHEAITQYGYVFPKGKDIEVTDPFAIRKLSNHPHFKAQEQAQAQDITDVQSRDLERELQDLTAAEVKRLEASKAEQAATATTLTDKDLYGNDERPSDADASEVEGDSGERGTRRGRPPKGG